MTGQGAAQLRENGVAVIVELRTVNNRYYKLALRTSDGYSSLESRIDELIREKVRRGTVQLDVRIEREAAAEDYRLNEVALTSYFRQLEEVKLRLRIDGATNLEQLLVLPGVVRENVGAAVDVERIWPTVERALRQGLSGLARMRLDEGEAMGKDLAENCRTLSRELDAVEQLAPAVVASYRHRLRERLNRLLEEHGVSVDGTELVREVGLMSERSDISEEIVRLRSHVEQFLAIMDAAESSGRKLEFVTQEMFREANTIGSKANDAQIARHVVEIKTAIERMREMIQNVE